jgi:hypothetical protein
VLLTKGSFPDNSRFQELSDAPVNSRPRDFLFILLTAFDQILGCKMSVGGHYGVEDFNPSMSNLQTRMIQIFLKFFAFPKDTNG